jgi:hypothetical protein
VSTAVANGQGTPTREAVPFCPSAQPTMDGAFAFGVVGGTLEEPRVGYLEGRVPVTDELLALAGPVKPTQVFRFGAPCVGGACTHFDGADCKLATKLVQLMPPASKNLPACQLRPDCRWWKQEGKAACMRCPQVMTDCYTPPNQVQSVVANPNTPVAARV